MERGPAPEIAGVTDRLERRPSRMCYHTKFGRFRSNRMGDPPENGCLERRGETDAD